MNNLSCIQSHSLDPSYNLALEEFLLKKRPENIFFLCRNAPSVIVGKHQNAYAEINSQYAGKNNIRLLRRISGGGAVYHDPGNIHFSFIINKSKQYVLNYQKMLAPIIDLLRGEGLDVSFDGKNGLLVNNAYKISGNAQHVFKARLLHHGTLLYSSDLNVLKNVLSPENKSYLHKGVLSNPFEVSNIKDMLSYTLNEREFMNFLATGISSSKKKLNTFLSAEDKTHIRELMDEKYNNDTWNIGKSPDYVLNRIIELHKKKIHLTLSVRKGTIIDENVKGAINEELKKKIEASLHHSFHEENELKQRLTKQGISQDILPKILSGLF